MRNKRRVRKHNNYKEKIVQIFIEVLLYSKVYLMQNVNN